MTDAPNTTTHHDIVVIGAGFAGLGMGMRLKQAGVDDFIVVEKDAGVGGTWWANRYPGAACDIPSHLYSYSFAPNPHWSRHYSPQAEIQAYLEDCAQRFGLASHLRLRTTVTSARYDDQALRWWVTLQSPEGDVTITARVLIAANGGLSRPAVPDLPGLEDFRGWAFHTARWPDNADVQGARVGVIGTGASAIQVVPAIVDQVAHLAVFQRTPPWIIPKTSGAIGARLQGLYARWPILQRFVRSCIYVQHEVRALNFTRFPGVLRALGKLVILYMKHQVRDPTLRELLTPRYVMGCKRILLASDYYPALQKPNATLVTSGIERIVADGVITQDGRHHRLDTLVLATGFDVADAKPPFPIVGRYGAHFDDAWRNGPIAYLGSTVPAFPNLFMIVGPNTGLGHNSMIYMIESQIAYVLDALTQMRMQGAQAIDVKAAAFTRYNEQVQSRLQRTVWATGGCQSWYRSASGRITTLWPSFTFEFRRRTRRVAPDDYDWLKFA
jgi:cation diffusion facilitator CzcD-associated flavoprotein CzcO